MSDHEIVVVIREWISKADNDLTKYYLYDTGAVGGDLGAKLENVVATALLRELHSVEDTRGSRTSLHYLRDKEKNEVDFLAIVDGKPILMVEVKSGHDLFAHSLLRFHSYLPSAKAVQVVHDLDRRKSTAGAEMLPAHEFLAELTL